MIGKISQYKPIEQSLRNDPSSQLHTTLPSSQVPLPLQIGVPGHVAMSQRSPVNPLKHSQIPVLPMQVPLPLHVVESSHTTKKVLCTLLRILQNDTLQTYSSFLDYLHHPCSNFREWQGHQFQSQCKGTALDCLSLQNSSQQLIKRSFIKDCIHSILTIIR